MPTITTIEIEGPTFTQDDADRLETALIAGAKTEVTIDSIRFTAHCPVGAFVLIDELARAEDRRWSVRAIC